MTMVIIGRSPDDSGCRTIRVRPLLRARFRGVLWRGRCWDSFLGIFLTETGAGGGLGQSDGSRLAGTWIDRDQDGA